jgi:hypothetical protein
VIDAAELQICGSAYTAPARLILEPHRFREHTMARWLAKDWTLDIITIDHGHGPVQEYRLRHGQFTVYSGADLVRVRLLLEDGGLSMADLEPQGGGAAATDRKIS